MAKPPHTSNTPPEAVISIIGAGMALDGDSETDGSLRVEGRIRGNVRAGKSVVIGKDGFVDGSIHTQDAVIAGRVSGGIHALSRLELLASSEVSGEIEAPRMQVEEGAKVQGQVAVGESVEKGGLEASQPEAAGPEGAEVQEGANTQDRVAAGESIEKEDLQASRPESVDHGGGDAEPGRQPEEPAGPDAAESHLESAESEGAEESEGLEGSEEGRDEEGRDEEEPEPEPAELEAAHPEPFRK